jgi:DNA-binding SARP family transcriptional activator
MVVDIETRRKKQQDLMIRMVERKVRERAQQLYEERGQVEGQALADWVQAETEVLDDSFVAPLYRRAKVSSHGSEEQQEDCAADFAHDPQPAY